MHCINKAEGNHLAEPASLLVLKNTQAARQSADGLSDLPDDDSD